MQAEALQAEVEQLKEKLEEMILDLQIYEESNQGGTEGAVTNHQVCSTVTPK